MTHTVTSTATTYATVLDDGHADYAVRLVNGQLTAQVKDGTVAGKTTWRDPADVVLHLKPAAASTVPPSGFSFLGPAGSPIWQIPQSQRQGILWLGWNTEALSSGQVSGTVTWSLDKVEGPGALAIYLLSAFGQPQIVFNSRDGVPDRYQIPLGTHAHGNWAFTAEGAYRLTFTNTATVSGRSQSDTVVLTVAVGSADPKALARRTTKDVSTQSGLSCDGRLVLTGSSLAGPLTLGGGLLLAGAILVATTYRRRRRA